jgi:hypothetical protein
MIGIFENPPIYFDLREDKIDLFVRGARAAKAFLSAEFGIIGQAFFVQILDSICLGLASSLILRL